MSTDRRKILTIGKSVLLLLAEAGKLTFETMIDMADYRRRSWRTLHALLGGPAQSVRKPKRETLSTTLWRLQKQGLIARGGRYWQLTSVGRKAIPHIAIPRALPQKDGKRRLVVFDIPETEKGKRIWIRRELRAYEYEPLQKSVWIGTRPLPKRFFKEARELDVLDYIRIFEISRDVSG